MSFSVPSALSTPQVDQLAHDAAGDVAAVVAQAKDDAKAQIDTAVSAATTLLKIAAGDVTALLPEAEAAAISLVVSKAPPWAQGIVSGFASSVASKTFAAVNGQADAAVQTGLAHALFELQALATHADAVF